MVHDAMGRLSDVENVCEGSAHQTLAYLAVLCVSSALCSVWNFRHRLLAGATAEIVFDEYPVFVNQRHVIAFQD